MCLYAAAPVCGSGVEERRGSKDIVSLTSYPKRFRYLHLTVKSLLLQTVKPDKIILYLGDDARDVPLPEALVRLKRKVSRLNIVRGIFGHTKICLRHAGISG